MAAGISPGHTGLGVSCGACGVQAGMEGGRLGTVWGEGGGEVVLAQRGEVSCTAMELEAWLAADTYDLRARSLEDRKAGTD